jgi:hypothetical protein
VVVLVAVLAAPAGHLAASARTTATAAAQKAAVRIDAVGVAPRPGPRSTLTATTCSRRLIPGDLNVVALTVDAGCSLAIPLAITV